MEFAAAIRIRKKPGQFARLRSIMLNILRANGVTNVATELFTNALNFQNMIAYPFSRKELKSPAHPG